MKRLVFLILVLFVAGCAHNPSGYSQAPFPVSSPSPLPVAVSEADPMPLKSPEGSDTSARENPDDQKKLPALKPVDPPEPLKSSPGEAVHDEKKTPGNDNPSEEEVSEKEVSIADPLEPFNRAMFHFNDKLYFWVLKPVAQGYNKVVPEPARVGVKNFFSNLGFPTRFVSSLLRADFKGAATQLGRFVVNTVWGAGGFLDPSSSEQLSIPKQDADLGQTLGIYGVGQGFYIVWPFLGPSSARDSVNFAGSYFLDPLSYFINPYPWYDWLAVRAYEEVNDTSLSIGDYESLKEAAIDPYVAIRNAYDQYRQKKVEAGRGKPEPPKPAGVQ
jgi:phospholipid-binding lipoprotein MlaA